MSSDCNNDNPYNDIDGWIFFDNSTVISFNSVMSVDDFKVNFCYIIGGSDSVAGDNNDYSSVDSDVAQGSVVGEDDSGNDDDDRKGKGRR